MPISPLRLIKNSIEYCHKSEWPDVPKFARGIYVLYRYSHHKDAYNVVYVGMAGGENVGVKYRLRSHARHKATEWTHFSVYQVWDNISEEEVKELEGLFRHIYRWDTRANRLNKQRSYKKLNQIRSKSFDEWR